MTDCKALKLYHFTAKHLAPKIRREGISKGCISVFDDQGYLLAIRNNWKWLTDEPRFDLQSWNTNRFVKYDRCAVRFTVQIPDSSCNNLHPAIAVIKDDFPNSLHLMNWPGSYHWWLYEGKIFRKWIVSEERATT